MAAPGAEAYCMGVTFRDIDRPHEGQKRAVAGTGMQQAGQVAATNVTTSPSFFQPV